MTDSFPIRYSFQRRNESSRCTVIPALSLSKGQARS